MITSTNTGLVRGRDVSMKGSGRVLYCVWADVDAEIVDEWTKWYEGVHVPAVVKKGGFLGARRFLVKEGEAPGKYLTIYEAKDTDQLRNYLEGPAGQLRKDYDSRYGSKSRISRMILEELSSFEQSPPGSNRY